MILAVLLIGTGCKDPESLDPEPAFRFPLKDYHVIQDFGNTNVSFGGQQHTAEDVAGVAGTAVFAAADGELSFSGEMGGYGYLIILDHSDYGVYTLYGHLSAEREKLSEGEVLKGDLIAYLADDDEDGSGGAYPNWGPHLHFSIRQGLRSDYPAEGDNRWMAGYTPGDPEDFNWIHPTGFISAVSSGSDPTSIYK